ncbi:Cof-type HAD-IIB family hydrolase [uncultured Vagococcus sp.]|uniref:Cof-type HAD-IIB family hydrolase n=1 Tax=uncultured Vagococcus sp. TaxID=189676 RepID=UPI0028D7FA0C|nr:Cof-type HAD-IIB family hydrolase [uncultured Vagococcus sp.]
MEKKLVFIDIDGTLVDRHEQIPPSAQEAIHRAKANGHLLYLCTGRSKPEIYDHLLAVGFDGVIGAGGGFIESQGEIIFHRQVTEESVRHMVDYFVEKGFSFYLESNGGLYGNVQLEQHLTDLVTQGMTEEEKAKQGKHPFLEKITFSDDNLYRNDVNKACFLENPHVPFKEIQTEFNGEFDVIHCTVPVFGDDSGELMVPGIHKGVAIEFLLNHLDISQDATVGIGDGMNDKEMLELCQIGIAMGNAKEGLKAVADYITTDLEEDGLYNAFNHYGLI